MKEFSEIFKEKAKATACIIYECDKLEQSFDYIFELIANKPPCELLYPESCEQGPLSKNNLPTRLKPVIAIPDFPLPLAEKFQNLCHEKNIICISENLANYLAGIDIGIAHSFMGIAQSGTCAVNTNNEDVRLATMISEICLLILKKSDIKLTLTEITENLRTHINNFSASYTSFMTGPSRTADIERIGAIGVHGCLELHLILINE